MRPPPDHRLENKLAERPKALVTVAPEKQDGSFTGFKGTDPIPLSLLRDIAYIQEAQEALTELDRLRALNRDRQRRFRERKAGKA